MLTGAKPSVLWSFDASKTHRTRKLTNQRADLVILSRLKGAFRANHLSLNVDSLNEE